jgi:type IV secretion system protein VirB6
VGVLTAVGPIFIALFLFDATRGLFVGWLRALLTAALAPMAGWMAASLMLIVVQPDVVLLASQRAAGHIDVDVAVTTAAVIFVFAVVQIGLLAAGALIAFSFRLGPPRSVRASWSPAVEREAAPVVVTLTRAERLANHLRRSDGTGPSPRAPGAAADIMPSALAAPTVRRTAAFAPRTPAAPEPRLTSAARRPSIRSREGFWTGARS